MKIVIVGNDKEGLSHFRDDLPKIKSTYLHDIGAQFNFFETDIDGKTLRIQIWCLNPLMEYKDVRSVYYLGSLGAIIIFNINSKDQFESVDVWVQEILEKNGKGNISLLIYGNVSEKRTSDSLPRDVVEKYIKKLTEQGTSVKYIEGSLKRSERKEEIFQCLGKSYFQYLENKAEL